MYILSYTIYFVYGSRRIFAEVFGSFLGTAEEWSIVRFGFFLFTHLDLARGIYWEYQKLRRASGGESQRRNSIMKLDRNAVNALLSLDDEQLKAVIRGLAARSGVDLGAFHISEGDIASVRRALSMATDEDISRAARQLGMQDGGK